MIKNYAESREIKIFLRHHTRMVIFLRRHTCMVIFSRHHTRMVIFSSHHTRVVIFLHHHTRMVIFLRHHTRVVIFLHHHTRMVIFLRHHTRMVFHQCVSCCVARALTWWRISCYTRCRPDSCSRRVASCGLVAQPLPTSDNNFSRSQEILSE